MAEIVPFIMAGGAGTRLWPLSNNRKPKQYHNLSGRGTLFEETIKRFQPLSPSEIVVATSTDYADLTQGELDKIRTKGTILAEPAAKNTAAAVLYGALYLHKRYNDSIMIVSPADHHISDHREFTRIIKLAINEAQHGNLVTIGIKPDYPETGFGYIKAESAPREEALHVDSFVEKPDLATARSYLADGSYFWNSGIFVWKTSAILEAFRTFLPDHVRAFSRLENQDAETIASNDEKQSDIKKKIFNSIDSVSIDYGIMEHARNRVVVPADFGWCDLGSWKAIDNIIEPDDAGNRTTNNDAVTFHDSHNCTVFRESKRISIVGLQDIVVVEANDEILVLNKNESQKVKDIVERLQKQ